LDGLGFNRISIGIRMPQGKQVPVIINGIKYSSITEAVEKIGIRKQLLEFRLKSPDFPAYQKEGVPKESPKRPADADIHLISHSHQLYQRIPSEAPNEPQILKPLRRKSL